MAVMGQIRGGGESGGGETVLDYNYFASASSTHTFSYDLDVAYICNVGGIGTWTGTGAHTVTSTTATGSGQGGGCDVFKVLDIKAGDTYVPKSVSVGSSAYSRTYACIIGHKA